MRASALLICLLALAIGGPAVAQGLETQPLIAGNPMRCYDYRGAVVRTLKTTELGDVGRASIIARMPIISLDSDRMATLPAKMQVFFYMHECAHHVLGHVIRPTLESEREADCWSINYGRAAGLFSRTDVEAFAPHFARSNGSRFGHLPGPERQAYLLKCFDEPDGAQTAFSR
ncbi:hypothetical protein [Hyphomicrobium sp.]|uniref:hypothetical protein n=1 Tax=Hyphomicrobium sp. TaxID=82 RepID=UPI0025C61D01|nr:hypothetical protein [Hyphomicrobium sp.]MCC7253376.1 hypothetical protein [Hyphomicrobium sp.]